MITPVQAVALSEHHHYTIFALFVLGYVLHAGLQVDAVARAKNNPTKTRLAVIELNWIRLASRFFVSLMIFLWVWKNPSLVPSMLGYLGLSLSSNAIAILTLPISPPVAGGFGFAVDSALAYIPVLKNSLPPIEGAAHAAAAEAEKTVEQAKVAADAAAVAESVTPEKP